jgi:4-amino-4-deoxy-L-arabinose transferase-like glycosyltransferase
MADQAEARTTNGTTVALSFAGLSCLCGFLFFVGLGDRDLWASHEARAAQNAQRILDDGNWLLPRLFDDQVEMQKPPLYYWLAALAGWVRGGAVDAVVARSPAAIAGLATVLTVFGFLAARGRVLAGLFAGLFLATAHHFTWISRTGRIDIPLTFTVTVAILSISAGRDATRSGRAHALKLVGYVSMAAGVMLKGPIGVALPLAVLVADTVLGRRTAPRSLVWGLPLVAAVAGPWFVIAHLRTGGEFTRVFFWYHHFQRATGGAAALASHPWWFYGPRLAVDFLPWSPLLPAAAFVGARRPKANHDPLARLGLLWLVAILALLSLSRFKRADYLLPAYPGIALWLGCVGERLYERWRSPQKARWLSLAVCGSVAVVVVGWTLFLHVVVPAMDAEREKRTFAAEIRQLAPRPELVLLFRVEDHLLSYHLARPLNTFVEWENLAIWVGRPESHLVLMPAESAAAWRQYITSGSLDEVLRYTDRTDRTRPRDLVLMRTQRGNHCDGPAYRPTADQQGADQRAAAGLQPGGRAGADR